MSLFKNIFNFCREKLAEVSSNLENQNFRKKIEENFSNVKNFKKEKSTSVKIPVSINIPVELKEHFYNLLALMIPYCLVSLIIYPTFSLYQFLQEIFSLFCIYCAVLFLFMDKLSDISRYRIVIGVTACAVPIIFINNSFAVALISICLMIFAEFICSEYLRGCFLFSNKIPVCVICNNFSETDLINSYLNDKYRIIELITIESENENNEIRNLKSLQHLRKKLKRLNWFAFFPFPRRILYFFNSSNISSNFSNVNISVLSELTEISSEFGLPLFKISGKQGKEPQISPVSVEDFDTIQMTSREENIIEEFFKGKRVWIFYDGRKSVLDLILAIKEIANLTIFCESENLMHEMENISRSFHQKHKIKIADRYVFSSADTKPDILFFNMPMQHLDSSDDNLKEAFVKNVFNVSEIVETAQKLKIKFVFFLSTMEAFNIENWIGATQRLGELIVQSVGIEIKKSQTKFRVIRLPNCISDSFGLFEKTIEAIIEHQNLVSSINFESAISADRICYSRNDIFHPLIELIISSLKEHYISSDIYSIIPGRNSQTNIVDIACSLFCIKNGIDIKNRYIFSDAFNNFPSISLDELEETDIASGIMRTKFSISSLKDREIPHWNIEQINKISVREIISAVFQSIRENNKESQETNVNSEDDNSKDNSLYQKNRKK